MANLWCVPPIQRIINNQMSTGQGTDEPEFYEIENIIGKRYNRRRIEYLILWKGFPEEEATWEAERHLKNSIPEMIEEYEDALKSRVMKGQIGAPKPRKEEESDSENEQALPIKEPISVDDGKVSARLEAGDKENMNLKLADYLSRSCEVSFGAESRKSRFMVNPVREQPQKSFEVNQTLKGQTRDGQVLNTKKPGHYEEQKDTMNGSLAAAIEQMSPFLQNVSEPLRSFKTKNQVPARQLRRSVRKLNKKAQKKKKLQEKRRMEEERKIREEQTEEEESVKAKQQSKPHDHPQSQVQQPDEERSEVNTPIKKRRGRPAGWKKTSVMTDKKSEKPEDRDTVQEKKQSIPRLEEEPHHATPPKPVNVKQEEDSALRVRKVEEPRKTVAKIYPLPRVNPRELFYLVEYSEGSLRKMSLLQVMKTHPRELSEELIDSL